MELIVVLMMLMSGSIIFLRDFALDEHLLWVSFITTTLIIGAMSLLMVLRFFIL